MVLDCSARVTGLTAMRAIIFLTFFRVFLQVFCKLGLGFVYGVYFIFPLDGGCE